MITLAIDPGTTHSGVVLWGGTSRRVLAVWPDMPNAELRRGLVEQTFGLFDRVACEWFQSMGMTVGAEVFETCRFIGVLEECCRRLAVPMIYIKRPTVKTRLCGTPRAKDTNVRQALLDLLGPVGTKKRPGPLFGVSSHAWAALAVAIAIDLQ